MSPAERSLAARRAAHLRWAREDPNAPDGPLHRARKAFRDRFEREVDPDGRLDPAERARRAESLRRAFYLDLARKSVRARRARAAAGKPTVDGAA